MIASFDREEEQDFEELVLFLKEKGYRDCTGMASADNVLKYINQRLRSGNLFMLARFKAKDE